MTVEVGYTSETRYAGKLQENMTQHGKPQHALSRFGFEVSILPVILGTTGGVFNSNLDSFRAIGISNERALHLISTLSKHAVDYMPTILDMHVSMRRLMQRLLPP